MMEDPWGSPWTTADSTGAANGVGGNSNGEATTDLAEPACLTPPPRAFLTTASTSPISIPALSYHSPWDNNDNDDFGDWSAADTAGLGNSRTNSLSVWGGWAADGSAAGGGTGAAVAAPPSSSHTQMPWGSSSRENSVLNLASHGSRGSGSQSPSRALSRSKLGENSLEKTSPIAWPSNAASAPSSMFKTLSRSSSNSILRLPSLDPWTSETSPDLDLPPGPGKITSSKLPSPATLDTAHFDLDHGTEGHASPGQELGTNAQVNLVEKSDSVESPRWGHEEEEHSLNAVGAAGTGDAQGSVQEAEDANPAHEAPVGEAANYGSRPSSEGSEPQSRFRASSSCSDDSQDSEEGQQDEKDFKHGARQDSPITSIDEESKTRAQQKALGKVQNLVDMYDDLAKKAALDSTVSRTPDGGSKLSREPKSRASSRGFRADSRSTSVSCSARAQSISRTRSPSLTDTTEDQAEARKDPSSPTRSSSRGTPKSKRRPRCSTASQNNRFSRSSSPSRSIPEAAQPRSPQQEVTSSPPRASRKTQFQQLIDKFGAVQFMPDLKLLDKLLDKSTPDSAPVLEGVETEIPDRVLYDSFVTTEERKAWYRVSRQGSTRLHNAGDDELYRRVAWPTSEVHSETIKIVRRWMEEDSIAGRPTLGGVGLKSKRNNIFGWDTASSDEPVRLDEFFGKRRQHQPHRPSSGLGAVPSGPEKPRVGESAASGFSPPQSTAAPRWSLAEGGTNPNPAGDLGGGPSARPLPTHLPPLLPDGPQPSRPANPFALAPAPAPTQIAVNSSVGSATLAKTPTIPTTALEVPATGSTPGMFAAHDYSTGTGEGDDDGWGEMVSSPSADGANANATLSSLQTRPETWSTPHEYKPSEAMNDSFFAASAKPASLPLHRGVAPNRNARHTIPSNTSDEWELSRPSPSLPGASSTYSPAKSYSFAPQAPTTTTTDFSSSAAAPFSVSPAAGSEFAKDTAPELISFAANIPASGDIQVANHATSTTSTAPPDSSLDTLVRQVIQNLPDLSYMLR